MIKVKFLKSHSAFSYFAGEVGYVTPAWAEKLLPLGYIIIIPEEIKEFGPSGDAGSGSASDGSGVTNTLPADLPARDKLFAAGFDTIEKVRAAGDGLLDVVGVSNNILKKINKYLKG
jgi:hypothetical protein